MRAAARVPDDLAVPLLREHLVGVPGEDLLSAASIITR